jgi:hypothetical protein
MTGDELRQVARGLYGPRFVAPLARDLGVRRDVVYRLLEVDRLDQRTAAAVCGVAYAKGSAWARPLATALRESYGVREIDP